jgi:hypothetical protein
MLAAASFPHRRPGIAPPDPGPDEDPHHRSVPRQRKRSTANAPGIAVVGVAFTAAAAAVVVTTWGIALLLLHRRLPRLESMRMLDPFLSNEGLIGAPSRIVFHPALLSAESSSARVRQPRLNTLPRHAASHEGGASNATLRRSSNRGAISASLHYEEDLILHRNRRSGPVMCRPPTWSFLHFPNCNLFHEFDLAAMPQKSDGGARPNGGETREEEEDSFVIARGYYRDVWVLAMGAGPADKVVLKTTRYRHDVDVESLMNAKRDALIMERLASRDSIISAFGHCGASTVVEAVPYEVEQYVVPSMGQQYKGNNMFAPGEKLRMALEMAESLALLHGYEGGAISHNDVQLSQWLRSKRDRLVLGDFHSSRILSWNHQQQAYCPYSTGTVFGNVRVMLNQNQGSFDYPALPILYFAHEHPVSVSGGVYIVASE